MMIELGAYKFNNALYYACRYGHLEIVKMMIELGANDYNDGIRGACEGGHTAVVKMMIDLGADNYYYLKCGNLECKTLYERLAGKVNYLPLKKEHPEYHLLKVYRYKIPDIDRIINKYLF